MMSHRPLRALSLCVLLGSASALPLVAQVDYKIPEPAETGVNSDTVSLKGDPTAKPNARTFGDFVEGAIVDVSDAGTSTLVGKTIEGYSELETRRATSDAVEALGIRLDQDDVRDAMNKGGDTSTGQALLNESDEVAEGLEKSAKDRRNVGKFGKKLAKVLDKINLMNLVMKSAGYASVGDFNGAVNTFIKEGVKKGMEAGGAAGLSWLPGGQYLGAIGGEMIFKKYIEGEMEAIEDQIRNMEYAKKYLNKPWLPVRRLPTLTGKIIILEPDQYFDRETGLIKRRSPREQALYESVMRNNYVSHKKWEKIQKQYADGELTEEEFEKYKRRFEQRDPTELWDPEAITAADVLNPLGGFSGTYSGRMTGGGSGSVSFTVNGSRVSGKISGSYDGDGVVASFSGTVAKNGMMTSRVSGRFTDIGTSGKATTFTGTFNGMLSQHSGGGGGGTWTATNKWGSPTGTWSAARTSP